MVLPVTTFTDPRLSQPIQPQGIAQALQTGVGMAGQLQKMRESAMETPAKVALEQAQAKEALSKAADPFAAQGLSGEAHDAMSKLWYLRKFSPDPSKINPMQVLSDIHDEKSRALNIRNFQLLPSDDRSNLIAKGRTLGYSGDESARMLSEGYTLTQMAQMKQAGTKTPPPGGNTAENFSTHQMPQTIAEVQHHTRPINAIDIKPTFAAQPGSIAAQQKAASATAGMDYLSKAITSGLNYGGWYSPVTRPWFWDAQSNDPTKQSKAAQYYAAQSIKPELALYRMRVQQGQSSARAMKALEPTILGSVKTNLSYLPAAMQRRIQDKVRQILDGATYQSSLQVTSPTPTTYKPKTVGQTIAATGKRKTTPTNDPLGIRDLLK